VLRQAEGFVVEEAAPQTYEALQVSAHIALLGLNVA
jgi:hypothetical protein